VFIRKDTYSQSANIKIKALQGKSERFSLKLSRRVKSAKVTSTKLKDWAFREDTETKQQFIDIFPKGDNIKEMEIAFYFNEEIDKTNLTVYEVLTFAPVTKESGGFSETVIVSNESNAMIRPISQNGYQPVESSIDNVDKYLTHTGGSLKLSTNHTQFFSGQNYVDQLEVDAVVSEDGKSADLRCISLVTKDKGEYPFDLTFVAPIEEVGGWKQLKFDLVDSAIVPIKFTGLSNAVKANTFIFDKESNVVPSKRITTDSTSIESAYSAFLPSEGGCDVRWKNASSDKKSKLFFTTNSIVDVQVGGGMLRQKCLLQGKILQGKLDKYAIKLVGEGDVMNVTGDHVSHWNVNENRELIVQLTGAYEQVADLTILTQQPLGSFPAKVNPIKLTPISAERHTGFVRVMNRGAVTFDQVYVYRFPSKERNWKIEVDQVLAKLSVRHLLVYGVGLSDRSLSAEINLEVKEAALREWEVLIPDSYTVSSVSGASVNDYVLSKTVIDGMRSLKVQFKQPLLGLHLIKLMLEKNQPAEEGEWQLPKIEYPGVEDVRGQIGVASELGWRISNGTLNQLSEIPLAYFQKKSEELQQSYRQRKPEWDATVKIEKLTQSVAADMFHLYTVKEGLVECGVVINYFVVGAPTNEWRLQVPTSAANIKVVGQNVRSHKREGDFVIVNLEQPAMGSVNLFIKYEQAIGSDGGELNLGQVIPLGVESESGYVQVVSPLQVNHELLQVSDSLIQLEESELPAELRLYASVPTVAVWQYSTRPFDIGLKINWYTASEFVNQSVDYATIETSLTKEGRAKTKATFYVKSRGKQNLRMKLPEGAEFWGVTANGERLNVRIDGNEYLIPLPVQVDLNTPVVLEISYGSLSEDTSLAKLGVPILSAPIVVANWKVKSEDDQHIVPLGGSVSGSAPYRGQTGFGWVGQHLNYVAGVLTLLAAGSFMLGMKKKAIWKTCIGFRSHSTNG